MRTAKRSSRDWFTLAHKWRCMFHECAFDRRSGENGNRRPVAREAAANPRRGRNALHHPNDDANLSVPNRPFPSLRRRPKRTKDILEAQLLITNLPSRRKGISLAALSSPNMRHRHHGMIMTDYLCIGRSTYFRFSERTVVFRSGRDSPIWGDTDDADSG